MKIKQTLLFFLCLLTATVGILFIFPENGIPIGFGEKIWLPTLTEVLKLDKEDGNDARSSIINEFIAPDSVQISDVLQSKVDSANSKRLNDSLRNEQLRLHFPPKQKNVLDPFFKALSRASKKPIRILHYGDSQIEGDRITGYVRKKMQSKFGGTGPGLIAPKPFASSPCVAQTYEGNWESFRLFMARDDRIEHHNFGPMLKFVSILREEELQAELKLDSLEQETKKEEDPKEDTTGQIPAPPQIALSASVKLTKSILGTRNVKDWRTFKLFLNPLHDPFELIIKEDSTQVLKDTIRPGMKQNFVSWKIQNPALKSMDLQFTTMGQFPEITAYSIEGKPGVWMDNIAMRGSGGVSFRTTSVSSLRSFYSDNNIPLIIMQFGGNALHGARSDEECEQYGRKFEKNLRYLKRLLPKACIIVIGPSDLSIKKETKWETHPFLEKTRDEMKRASFANGAVYWDTYEAMGGENTMPLWVESTPALASEDHVHFSPQGARKVADWFYTALITEYNNYKKKGADGK